MSDVSKSYNEQAKQYDSFIEKLVPDYAEFNALIPQVIGFPKTILDIGCGTGNTSAKLISKFPSAKLTCLDTSSAMIEAAKLKLGDVAEFRNIAIEEFKPEKTFDAITSMMVMHNVQTIEKRQSIYQMIFEALNKNGVYASVDIFKGESDFTDKLRFDIWRNFLLNSFTEDEVDNKWLALHNEKDKPLRLSQHISMLQDTGFQYVDVIHMRLGFALTVAQKGL